MKKVQTVILSSILSSIEGSDFGPDFELYDVDQDGNVVTITLVSAGNPDKYLHYKVTLAKE